MTRREEILKLIVEYFIRSGEPVGSQTLLDAYHLDCSSATVRAEMNALEKEGYLEKTHISSGRVPSAKGYQYYVEHLREERVDSQVKYALQSVLEKKAQSVEEVIKQACEILSSMTDLASVVLGAKTDEEHLVSVQLIPIGPRTVTAVFVTDQGYVENKTFVVSEELSPDDIQKAVTMLNDRLKGTPISQLVPKMEAMKPALVDYLIGQDVIYQVLLEAFLKFAGDRIDLYGRDNLLNHPEFAEDSKKLRKVLSLLDSPDALREAMGEFQDGGDIAVKIGAEEEGLDDLAILSAKVKIPGGQQTSLSLLGPTRIDYEKAMALLDYVSKTLDAYFAGETPKEEGEPPCPKKKTAPKKPSAKNPKKTNKKK